MPSRSLSSDLRFLSITLFVWGLILTSSGAGLEARSLYQQLFIKIYPQLEPQVKFEGCYLCHNYPLKKLNSYGKIIKDQMPAADMQDETRLRMYILKAAGYESEVAGKTFGDFIKEDQLPSKGCNLCTLE